MRTHATHGTAAARSQHGRQARCIGGGFGACQSLCARGCGRYWFNPSHSHSWTERGRLHAPERRASHLHLSSALCAGLCLSATLLSHAPMGSLCYFYCLFSVFSAALARPRRAGSSELRCCGSLRGRAPAGAHATAHVCRRAAFCARGRTAAYLRGVQRPAYLGHEAAAAAAAASAACASSATVTSLEKTM